MDELLMERYALAKERVCEIKEEKAVQMPVKSLGNTEGTFLSCMQSCVVLWSMPLKRGCGI